MSLALSPATHGNLELIYPHRSWEFLAILVWVPPETRCISEDSIRAVPLPPGRSKTTMSVS